MFWTERINRIAGVALLLLALGIILSIVLSSVATDADPFDRDEIQEFLTDIDDNRAAAVITIAVDITIDAFIGIVVAALVYLLFRDRNRLLALSGFALLLAGNAAFIASDTADAALIVLAEDFAEKGGPAGIGAGDAVILEVARGVAIWSLVAEQAAFTAIGLGFAAIGSLIAWAPAGQVTPPRWLGWLAVLAGAAIAASWLLAVADAFFFLVIVGGIALLIFLASLGIWLLMQPEAGETRSAPSPAPPPTGGQAP